MYLLRYIVVTAFTAALACSARSQCVPTWSNQFGAGDFSSPPTALAAYDSGSGQRLFACGGFSRTGGVETKCIAQWNGKAWSPVGGGLDQTANALVTGPGVGGPALYVGGNFLTAGSIPCSYVARWNGSAWSPLTGDALPGPVTALTFLDDGAGAVLYCAARKFAGSGSQGVFRYGQSGWAQIGGDFPSATSVTCLVVHDGGNGPRLIVGGSFVQVGGVSALRVAEWNGTTWNPLGAGLGAASTITTESIYCLRSFDPDGSGLQPPGLYAGGFISTSGDIPVRQLAKWDGSRWTQVGSGDQFGSVRSLTTSNISGSNLMYVGAESLYGAHGVTFTWDGSTLSQIPGTVSVDARAMTQYDVGGGPRLAFAGFYFSDASGHVPFGGIASWDGAQWYSMQSSNVAGGIGAGYNLGVFDEDGPGPQHPTLFVSGSIVTAGNVYTSAMARWNGTYWFPADGGLAQSGFSDATFTTFDPGSGSALYAIGQLSLIAGVNFGLSRWTGSSWVDANQGLTGTAKCGRAFDDGSGSALYVGGYDNMRAGTVGPSGLLRLRNGNWSLVGGAVSSGYVFDTAAYDDGSGPALYICGTFHNVDGHSANGIAKWNGTQWSSLGSGLGSGGSAGVMAVHDDGSGPALYVGGNFVSAGGIPAAGLARWKGSWSGVAGWNDSSVYALQSYNDGSGSALFVGGNYPSAFRKLQNGVWSSLPIQTGSVLALATFDDDGEGPIPPALYIVGTFLRVNGVSSLGIARWGCVDACYANCDNSTSPPLLNANDFNCFFNKFAAQDPVANCDNSTFSPVFTANDFNCFLNKFAAGCQ